MGHPERVDNLDINSYVYKKEVDWSLLNQGFSIPVSIQVVFQKSVKEFIKKGQKKEIYIFLNGKNYKATLVNQGFDEKKYSSRKDILQIRYNPGSDIAVELRNMFTESYYYLRDKRLGSDKKKKFFKTPEDNKEFLAIYTTIYKDTFLFECIQNEAEKSYAQEIKAFNETVYENSINYTSIDGDAGIYLSDRMVKVRRLNRAIGDNLKQLYNYRCQICDDNFSERYEVNIVEAHHIEPFTVSLNNNTDNLLILCPNHHRTIHSAEPVFLKKKAIYLYKNGVEEKIILNKHLAQANC